MDKALYDKGIAMRRKVLGDDYVDRAVANTTDFDRKFQDLLNEFAWGAVWGDDDLAPRDRSLLNLGMIACLGRMHEFEAHFRGAIRNGLTPKELGELRIIAQSIKDGETSWKEIMAAKDGGEPVETKRTTKLADAIKPAAKDEPGAGPTLITQEVHDAIVAASDADMLAQADDQINLLPKAAHKDLRELVAKRRYELTHPKD